MLLNTPEIQPGWQAPSFTLPDPDGTPYRYEDLMGDKGLLIAFICNHCPYVKAIAERFANDANTLQSEGINVIAINSNDFNYVHADSPPRMKIFAAQYDFSFAYLVDEEQTVARAYDAVCTPDFFGLNAHGKLHYRGRLDDAKMGNAENRTPELLNAMRLIAKTGKGPKEQYPSMGCSIKWKTN